jgi:type VI secretion system protein ImpA
MPCGENLEYDPEFILLFAKAEPKGEAQYGTFVAEAEAVNWTDIERECRRLLLRTKDIRIVMLLLRCRINLAHAPGLRDGLALLSQILTRYSEDVYPLPHSDGEADLTPRANALAALLDHDGIYGDIRNLTVSDARALRLQVRDVERAFGMPRPADALAPDSVRSQLNALWQQRSAQSLALGETVPLLQEIQDWSQARLLGQAPDLTPLLKLLGWFGQAGAERGDEGRAAVAPSLPAGVDAGDLQQGGASSPGEDGYLDTTPGHASPALGAQPLQQGRYGAREQIGCARRWFEQHEPSSPVVLLLWRAEQMVGLPFHELVRCLPGDLIDAWAKQMSEK